MLYHFKCIKRELIYFLLGLLCGLFLYKLDFSKVVLEDAYAVEPSNGYFANDMYLYPTIIMRGSSVSQNGSSYSLIENYNFYPVISFNSVANNDRLVFQQNLMLENVAYQFDIFTCGAPPIFKDDFKVGTTSNNVVSVSSLYHKRVPIGSVGDFSSCYVDSFYVNNANTGNFTSILLNANSSTWVILGYKNYPVGMSNSFYGNLRDTINNHTDSVISSANSNQNVKIENAISNQNVKIENAFNNQTSNIYQNANSNQQLINSNATSNTQQLISNNNSNFNEVNSNLTDDSLEANTGNDFFDNDNFSDQDDLLGLVTLPIEFAEELTESTCSPIVIPFTIYNKSTNINLPCMSTIYTTYFNSIYTIITTIVTGLIAYGCIMSMIKTTVKVLDPNNASLEVTDL